MISERHPETTLDLVTLMLEGDDRTGWRVVSSRPYVNSPTSENFAAFSPDGTWVVYTTTFAGGRPQLFVRPFPGPEGVRQLTTDGGVYPAWSKEGEIIYAVRTGGVATMMSLTYTIDGQSFKPGTPRPWSPTSIVARAGGRMFDIDPKSQRVVMAKATTDNDPTRNEAIFVFNLFDRLRELTGK